MTKIQAVSEWRREILSRIREQENGRPDYPMRRESWGMFVDSLHRDGRITDKQYDEWRAPVECRG